MMDGRKKIKARDRALAELRSTLEINHSAHEAKRVRDNEYDAKSRRAPHIYPPKERG